jgi:ribosome biogenesis protein Nip4
LRIFCLQETKMVFEKLYKFIGKDIKSMIERPDGRFCLRLHKNRVYYVSEALMKKATNVSSSGYSVARAIFMRHMHAVAFSSACFSPRLEQCSHAVEHK